LHKFRIYVTQRQIRPEIPPKRRGGVSVAEVRAARDPTRRTGSRQFSYKSSDIHLGSCVHSVILRAVVRFPCKPLGIHLYSCVHSVALQAVTQCSPCLLIPTPSKDPVFILVNLSSTTPTAPSIGEQFILRPPSDQSIEGFDPNRRWPRISYHRQSITFP